MDQELDEFELLWPEYYADHEAAASSPATAAARMEITLQMQQRFPARSRPVDVPGAALILRRWKEEGEEDHHQEEEDDGAGGGGNNRKINIVVPPHLMLSVVRRPYGDTPSTAAWFASATRKRARDLRLLRNSVLRMTGFIEG